MKKKLILFFIGCLSVSLLTGCSSSAANDTTMLYIEDEQSYSDEATVELTFFGFKTDAIYLTAIEDVLQSYMADKPSVHITYEGAKSSEYWDVLDLRIENDNLDNVFMVHHDDVVSLKKQGKLADLSSLSTISNYSAMAKSQFTESDGSVYFLPTQISTFNLYINENMLEDYGLEIPTNWSEFSQVCDFFVNKGIVPIVGNNFTTMRALIAAKSLYPVYQMEDPSEMIEKFNSGEVDIMDYLTEGIEMVEEMLDRGWIDGEEALNTNPTSDDLELFAAGDRPFMITGGWASPKLNALEPNFSYGIYPFPILEDGSVLVMNVDTCISVSAEADDLYTTKNFVEYLTQPDVITKYCDTQSCFIPLNEDWTPTEAALEPSVEYLFNGQNIIGADYRLELPLDNSENEVGKAILGGMGTEEAIEKMSELIHQ